jgi:hypothetical protein
VCPAKVDRTPLGHSVSTHTPRTQKRDRSIPDPLKRRHVARRLDQNLCGAVSESEPERARCGPGAQTTTAPCCRPAVGCCRHAATEHARRTWGAERAVNLTGTCRHPSLSIQSIPCAPAAVPARQFRRCTRSLRRHPLRQHAVLFFFSLRALAVRITHREQGENARPRSGSHQNTHCFGSPSTNRGTQLKRRGQNRVVLILLPGPAYSIRAINSAGMRSINTARIRNGRISLHVAPSCQPRPGPAGLL